MLIATPDFNALFDSFVHAFLLNNGSSGADAMQGANAALDAAFSTLAATGNGDAIIDLGPSLANLRDAQNALKKYALDAVAFIARAERHAKRFGGANFSSLNTMMTYNNVGGGGTWTMLQHPTFLDIYNALKGTPNTNVYPSPWNLYYEILQGGTFANGLAKRIIGGAYTDGASVPNNGGAALYAGGDLNILASGITGSDTVTITGTAYDPVGKVLLPGRTWTANVTGNGTFVAAVGTAPANSKVQDVSNIVAAAGLTVGTLYAQGAKPAGRL